MLQELSSTMPFWGRVINELTNGIESLSCGEVVDNLERFDEITSIPLAGAKDLPAIYCHHAATGSLAAGVDTLRKIAASRKLLIATEDDGTPLSGDFIVRASVGCPAVFAGGGSICLPYGGKWLAIESPNVSRVLWRIGFAHLADEEVNPMQAGRFFCPDCFNGDLILRQIRNEGWFLVCTNGQLRTCAYRRRLSLAEAKIKVRIGNMTCPDKHPLTVRQNGTRYFLGCENYPTCVYTEPLSILEGT